MEDVAYGQPAQRRKTWLERHKTALILTGWSASIPALIVSWLLFPVWFVPLHEIGWGPIAAENMAAAGGLPHLMLLIADSAGLIFAFATRSIEERWPWEPAAL